MSRSRIITTSSIVSVLALAMAASCGHTEKTLDSFQRQLQNPDVVGDGDAGDGGTRSTDATQH